jgi:hypothetical protein
MTNGLDLLVRVMDHVTEGMSLYERSFPAGVLCPRIAALVLETVEAHLQYLFKRMNADLREKAAREFPYG